MRSFGYRIGQLVTLTTRETETSYCAGEGEEKRKRPKRRGEKGVRRYANNSGGPIS